MRLVVASTVTCIAIGVANLTPFVPEGIAPHLSQLLGLIASVTLLACLFGWARAALRWSDAANGLDWREITRAQGREPAPCCLAGMLVVAGPVVEAGSLVLYKCCQQCGFTARLILGPASVTSPSPLFGELSRIRALLAWSHRAARMGKPGCAKGRPVLMP